jgi:uncharacterized protein YprB with RNaseH-like and TPR domain
VATRDRLSALRRQAIGDGAESREIAAGSLAARVDRLRAGRRAGPQATQRPPDEQTLAHAVCGQAVAPGVVLIEQRIPCRGWHGNQPLGGIIRGLPNLPEAVDIDPARLLYLDTETTGLAGGTGTHVFLLGLARLHREVLVVRQYLLARFSGEAALLTLARDWMADIEAVVSYNGKTFDLPLLSTRCRLSGVGDPFVERRHIDLLHSVRRAFGRSWEDCRLATAERRLMGFERRDDLPGAEAPQAWFDFIRRGDPRRLPGVCRHNLWDLVSLAALLPALDTVYRRPGRARADVLGMARSWLRRNDEQRALGLLSEYSHTLDSAGLLELARLLKRRRRWDEAQKIWIRLAGEGNIAAREHLAKYHEHVSRNYSVALSHASQLPPGPLKDHRCKRLNDRLS